MSVAFMTSRRLGYDPGQATYGMSNLRTKTTGLPFVVFISQKDDAKHAARVKWSRGPKVTKDDMGSYAISPFAHTIGPRLDAADEERLRQWVSLNEDVLRRYWNAEIAFTEDAIEQLKPI